MFCDINNFVTIFTLVSWMNWVRCRVRGGLGVREGAHDGSLPTDIVIVFYCSQFTGK